jgi:hypothetical protein
MVFLAGWGLHHVKILWHVGIFFVYCSSVREEGPLLLLLPVNLYDKRVESCSNMATADQRETGPIPGAGVEEQVGMTGEIRQLPQ